MDSIKDGSIKDGWNMSNIKLATFFTSFLLFFLLFFCFDKLQISDKQTNKKEKKKNE